MLCGRPWVIDADTACARAVRAHLFFCSLRQAREQLPCTHHRHPLIPNRSYGTQYIQPYGWRISLALGAVPALLLFVGSLLLPDTPNSLVERGHVDEGRRILEKVRGTKREHTQSLYTLFFAHPETRPAPRHFFPGSQRGEVTLPHALLPQGGRVRLRASFPSSFPRVFRF